MNNSNSDKNLKVDVLDHGFVRLVSYMQPATRAEAIDAQAELSGGEGADSLIAMEHLDPHWTGDLEIVRNARVSFNADWRTGEDEGKDAKLVHYMLNHKHSSPFEAMVLTFEVMAPIFVLRQWHRHRTWKYNEVSARYAEVPECFYIPKGLYKQSTDNKQGRTTELIASSDEMLQAMRGHCSAVFHAYHSLLAQGVTRELARSILPLNTYSRMFATVDLHNLMHFLRLRLDPHAQWEIRQYASALLQLARTVAPEAMKAFEASLPESTFKGL